MPDLREAAANLCRTLDSLPAQWHNPAVVSQTQVFRLAAEVEKVREALKNDWTAGRVKEASK